MEQIDKDVRRTLPDFAFFQQHVPMNHLNPLSPPVKFDPLDQDNVLPSESDPLSSLFTVEQETMSKKFSFGFMGRPRSSSSTSRKSTNNKSVHNTRARSNSKSSVRSFSSGILETGSEMISTPRSIVRKLSTVLKSNNKSNNNIHNHHYNGINGKRHLFTHPQEPICPYVSTRRNLFRRISHLNESIGNREHQTREKGDGSDKEEEEDADKYVMDYHWEAIERVLFIYAKLNPGVGYVQGMNELLAPIYYVFAKDDDLESQAYAEADSFFVFTTLMSDVRDHFVRSLDLDASSGINATLLRMSQRLLWFDRPLFRNMSKKNVKEQYYAFRWITVLCSQEWDLPDVIRLWDSILADRGMQEGADEGRFEFLLDFTVAMIM